MARKLKRLRWMWLGVSVWAGGCGHAWTASSSEFRFPPPPREPLTGATAADTTPLRQVAAFEAADTAPTDVDSLVQIAIARNPRLAKATFAIDAAQGKFIQAGLYPNPELAINWDEIGDRTGPGGILTAPQLSQTIVTGRKLSLSQAVAATEVNQANLALLNERYAVISSVRSSYYELRMLQERIKVQEELVQLANAAVEHGKRLLENKQIARLDLVQLEFELERFRAAAEALRQELPATRVKLSATIGDPRLVVREVDGEFETLPFYDPDRVLETVLTTHPEVRSARVGVEQAQAALRRAQAEPIPDLRFYTAYIRQDQNKSNDFAVGVSAAVPVWNRNQGNIRAAIAELNMAHYEVNRVENLLAERVATAYRTYASAIRRAERFRTIVLPKAREAAELSAKAFQAGQFTYLQVLVANRAVAEAKLEYVTSLTEAWKAAAELSGLLLEERWPGRPTPKEPKPDPKEPKPGPKLPPEPEPAAGPADLPTQPTDTIRREPLSFSGSPN